MKFVNPDYFWLLLVLPLLAAHYIYKIRKKQVVLKYNSLGKFGTSSKEYFIHAPFILRMLAIAAIIFALARPQISWGEKEIRTEGLDILLAIDISSSMYAEDIKPNRIEGAKNTIINFCEGRKTDRIGIIAFAKTAVSQCPLTNQYSIVKNLASKLNIGMLEDGTAIGIAIATAINHIKDSEAKSKVLILLTDGENNAGEIDPATAAQIAKEFDIKIYPVGFGVEGEAPYPVQTPFGKRYQNIPVKIDEGMLTQIADLTGGKYFRATNRQALEEIFFQIDQLEKTKINVLEYERYEDKFYFFLLIAAGLIFLEFIFKYLILRINP